MTKIESKFKMSKSKLDPISASYSDDQDEIHAPTSPTLHNIISVSQIPFK